MHQRIYIISINNNKTKRVVECVIAFFFHLKKKLSALQLSSSKFKNVIQANAFARRFLMRKKASEMKKLFHFLHIS